MLLLRGKPGAVPPPPAFMSATGGIVTTDGDYKVHIFLSSDNFEVLTPGVARVLVVGGGGGGGGSWAGAGGGGAELVDEEAVEFAVGIYAAIIGAGGPGSATFNVNGTNGNDSVFAGLTAKGGGGGGSTPDRQGNPGGSAGGSSGYFGTQPGAASTAVQGVGHAGGAGGGGSSGKGGGGGGADGPGQDGDAGGLGGPGLSVDITGSPITLAMGGNGLSSSDPEGVDGVANTGDGGDGTNNGAAPGKNGGSGIVIVRYRYQ